MTIIKNNTDRLYNLSGLKFLAMIMIVWWHLGNPSRTIDWGARMCEFLFVSSGFLVGYNYYFRGMPDSRKFSFEYVFKKLKTTWPLHIITTVFLIFVNIKSFQVTDIPSWISNFFLLQAWQLNKYSISFNGISWFLSALMFCYFLAPFFIKFIKHIKISVLMLFFVVMLRVSIELFESVGLCEYIFSIHFSPIIRSLEFFCGMLLVPVYYILKNKTQALSKKSWFILVWTSIQIALIVLTVFLMIAFDKTWLRAYYVIWFCVFTLLSAIDCGLFAILFSNTFIQKIVNLQFEIYLLQLVIDCIVVKLFKVLHLEMNINFAFVIKLCALFLIAFLYNRFIKNKLSAIMEKMRQFIKQRLSAG